MRIQGTGKREEGTEQRQSERVLAAACMAAQALYETQSALAGCERRLKCYPIVGFSLSPIWEEQDRDLQGKLYSLHAKNTELYAAAMVDLARIGAGSVELELYLQEAERAA